MSKQLVGKNSNSPLLAGEARHLVDVALESLNVPIEAPYGGGDVLEYREDKVRFEEEMERAQSEARAVRRMVQERLSLDSLDPEEQTNLSAFTIEEVVDGVWAQLNGEMVSQTGVGLLYGQGKEATIPRDEVSQYTHWQEEVREALPEREPEMLPNGLAASIWQSKIEQAASQLEQAGPHINQDVLEIGQKRLQASPFADDELPNILRRVEEVQQEIWQTGEYRPGITYQQAFGERGQAYELEDTLDYDRVSQQEIKIRNQAYQQVFGEIHTTGEVDSQDLRVLVLNDTRLDNAYRVAFTKESIETITVGRVAEYGNIVLADRLDDEGVTTGRQELADKIARQRQWYTDADRVQLDRTQAEALVQQWATREEMLVQRDRERGELKRYKDDLGDTTKLFMDGFDGGAIDRFYKQEDRILNDTVAQASHKLDGYFHDDDHGTRRVTFGELKDMMRESMQGEITSRYVDDGTRRAVAMIDRMEMLSESELVNSGVLDMDRSMPTGTDIDMSRLAMIAVAGGAPRVRRGNGGLGGAGGVPSDASASSPRVRRGSGGLGGAGGVPADSGGTGAAGGGAGGSVDETEAGEVDMDALANGSEELTKAEVNALIEVKFGDVMASIPEDRRALAERIFDNAMEQAFEDGAENTTLERVQEVAGNLIPMAKRFGLAVDETMLEVTNGELQEAREKATPSGDEERFRTGVGWLDAFMDLPVIGGFVTAIVSVVAPLLDAIGLIDLPEQNTQTTSGQASQELMQAVDQNRDGQITERDLDRDPDGRLTETDEKALKDMLTPELEAELEGILADKGIKFDGREVDDAAVVATPAGAGAGRGSGGPDV